MPKTLTIKGAHLGHKIRNAHTVRLSPEMYELLSGMSAETGIPLSTLVNRGLGIGIVVSAKLETGNKEGWFTETMTSKPVWITAQEPDEVGPKAKGWLSQVKF
jgi:Ribbon-helix-helix domain